MIRYIWVLYTRQEFNGFSILKNVLADRMKRSVVDLRPTPVGSLTLVSNLLWVVVNRGLNILGILTKLNFTKY